MYLAFRSRSSAISTDSDCQDPHHIVAFIPSESLEMLGQLAPEAAKALLRLPVHAECIHFDLGTAYVISIDESLPAHTDMTDLIVAISSLQEDTWLEIQDEEFQRLLLVLQEYFSSYLFCAQVYGYPVHDDIVLYVESPNCSQYWLDESLQTQLLRQFAKPTKSQQEEENTMCYPSEVLDYPVLLRRIRSDSEGYYYLACVPALGKWSVQADGDTPEQALQELQRVYKQVCQYLRRNHISVPVPPPDQPDPFPNS